MNMNKQDDKIVSIVGYILGVAIVGTLVCGVLECFSVRTGIIGGVFALITVLPIPLYLLYVIIKKLGKKSL